MMLTSCVNDIPYDAEIGAPKLVLNAMLRANGEQLTATVGRTAHFLDTEEPRRLYSLALHSGSQSPAHSPWPRQGRHVVGRL